MSWTFVEATPATAEHSEPGDWWAVIQMPDGREDFVDDCWPSKAEAEKGGREFCRYSNQEDRSARNERAMEAGMLHGIDAYNDAMGY